MCDAPPRHGVAEVVVALAGQPHRLMGDPTATFSRPRAVDVAGPGDLAWIAPDHPRAVALATACQASVILTGHALESALPPPATGQAFVLVETPRLAFARVLRHLFRRPPAPGIDASARVHPDARLGTGVHIGPGCVIGVCVIGDGVVILAGSVVNDGVRIGPGAVIQERCVVGAMSLGYQKDEAGHWLYLEHLGGVVLGAGVELGPGCVVDRGTLEDTVVCDGVKVGTGTHVGHNVRIGAHTLLGTHVDLLGSVQVGSGCWIAPDCVINERLRVGDNATVGLGAVVLKDVAAGATVFGNPARDISGFSRDRGTP